MDRLAAKRQIHLCDHAPVEEELAMLRRSRVQASTDHSEDKNPGAMAMRQARLVMSIC